MVVCRRSRSRISHCTIVNVSTPGPKNTNGILMSVFLVAETKITKYYQFSEGNRTLYKNNWNWEWRPTDMVRETKSDLYKNDLYT